MRKDKEEENSNKNSSSLGVMLEALSKMFKTFTVQSNNPEQQFPEYELEIIEKKNELMQQLPEEILEHILFFAHHPIDIKIRLVCHRWNNIITYFVNKNLGIFQIQKAHQLDSLEKAQKLLWDKQNNEIHDIQNNITHIIRYTPEVKELYKKLQYCPTGTHSIALQAREHWLNTFNKTIILARIVESQQEWVRYKRNNPRLVKKLDCRLCFLTRFPQSLIDDSALSQYWNTLEFLYLSHNKLTALPEYINMPRLVVLEIEENKLQFFPNKIVNLSRLSLLNLRKNNLTSLSSSIGELVSLHMLFVADNFLTNLPATFVRLRVLKSCYANNNQLTELPNNLPALENLELWDLSCNALTEIPEEIANIKNLKKLFLQSNKLLSLPSCIERLLYELGLSKTTIPKILKMQNIDKSKIKEYHVKLL